VQKSKIVFKEFWEKQPDGSTHKIGFMITGGIVLKFKFASFNRDIYNAFILSR
jgi:hypothetical protein